MRRRSNATPHNGALPTSRALPLCKSPVTAHAVSNAATQTLGGRYNEPRRLPNRPHLRPHRLTLAPCMSRYRTPRPDKKALLADIEACIDCAPLLSELPDRFAQTPWPKGRLPFGGGGWEQRDAERTAHIRENDRRKVASGAVKIRFELPGSCAFEIWNFKESLQTFYRTVKAKL